MSRLFRIPVVIFAIALLPAQAYSQAGVNELVGEINQALAQHPTGVGAYQVELGAGNTVVATRSDASGVVERWEMYAEDIGSVIQTRAGHVRLMCREDLGNCVRQICNGDFLQFDGCARASAGGRRLRNEMIISYEYDTRAHTRIQSAIDALMSQ